MVYLVPPTITAGLDQSWTAAVPEYDPGLWTLTLALRGAGSADVTAVATAYGLYEFTVASDVSAPLAPGRYGWAIIAADGVVQREVARGSVEVLANLLAAAPGYDPRAHCERVLAAVEAVLENTASITQKSYKINNRELQRTSLDELQRLRRAYQREVAELRGSTRGRRTLGRLHVARFVP